MNTFRGEIKKSDFFSRAREKMARRRCWRLEIFLKLKIRWPRLCILSLIFSHTTTLSLTHSLPLWSQSFICRMFLFSQIKKDVFYALIILSFSHFDVFKNLCEGVFISISCCFFHLNSLFLSLCFIFVCYIVVVGDRQDGMLTNQALHWGLCLNETLGTNICRRNLQKLPMSGF